MISSMADSMRPVATANPMRGYSLAREAVAQIETFAQQRRNDGGKARRR
jgi:hypothetical protein